MARTWTRMPRRVFSKEPLGERQRFLYLEPMEPETMCMDPVTIVLNLSSDNGDPGNATLYIQVQNSDGTAT